MLKLSIHKKYLSFFVAFMPFIMSLTDNSDTKGQGIEGHVYRISGNQMPSPDQKPNPPKGIKTTLYIYALTNLSQAEKQDQGPFYHSIHTKLIKKIQTNSAGYFKVELPVGHYSLFTKKDSLFFANSFDGANNISSVQVVAQKMTSVTFKIDYDAAY
jgi:hypothetical protein